MRDCKNASERLKQLEADLARLQEEFDATRKKLMQQVEQHRESSVAAMEEASATRVLCARLEAESHEQV